MSKNNDFLFAKRLAAWCASQRLSQTEVAKALGLTHRTVNRWVVGRTLPTPDALKALLAYVAGFDERAAYGLAVAARVDPRGHGLDPTPAAPAPAAVAPPLAPRS